MIKFGGHDEVQGEGNDGVLTKGSSMAEIEGLVRDLREGDDAAKTDAARALWSLAGGTANKAAIAEAGGIPPLIELLRDGLPRERDARFWAVRALVSLAYNDANKVLIAEAGGIPPLIKLMHDDKWTASKAAAALDHISDNNDANAVAIALTVGLEALVELARGGRVTVNERWLVRNASIAAKRKAALVVAALLRACVPEFKSAPGDIKDAIGSFL